MGRGTDFEGKVALVTGASAGIGRAVAMEFAERGASVIVADLHEERGTETVENIERSGGHGIFVEVDVADESAVKEMVGAGVKAFGRLDYLVNNAGIVSAHPSTPLHELSLESFEKIMAVNVTGTLLGMKYAIPEMLKVGGGAIVNLSSVHGARAAGGDPSYPTSKHAVVGLTRAAALTYATQGIRINSIGPGVVKTEMAAPATSDEKTSAWLLGETPMRRFAEPAEIAKVIAFLCSDDASYITGVYYPVDGGWLAG